MQSASSHPTADRRGRTLASPFYIQTASFGDNNAMAARLHRLCDTLNQLGYEAYVSGTTQTHGGLWTPQLSPQIQAAHYRAGRIPVAVRLGNAGAGATKHAGLLVEYVSEGFFIDGVEQMQGEARLLPPSTPTVASETITLRLPSANPELFYTDPSSPRNGNALLYAELLHTYDCTPRPEHAHATDISPVIAGKLSEIERATLLRQAPCLYAYETGTIVTEARLCGCPVIYVSNDRSLITAPQGYWDTQGTVWNQDALTDAQTATLRTELDDFAARYQQMVVHSEADVRHFAERANTVAQTLTLAQAWPGAVLEPLEEWAIEKKERARWADATKYRHLQEQYQIWRKRSSLREIDADIYAEHVASGTLPTFEVLLYATHTDMEAIASSLDSLEHNFWKPTHITVIAPVSCPVNEEELGGHLRWIQHDATTPLAMVASPAPWTLLLEAGTTLEPHALVEFALSARDASIQLVYCDDDQPGPDNNGPVPHFKPDANIEWLRAFNYLGSAIAVRSSVWFQQSNPGHMGNSYGLAMQLLAQHGKAAVAHIDTVLAHSTGQAAAHTEADEMAQLQAFLQQQQLHASVQPGQTWGTRLVEYHPKTPHRVSVIIPTGHQLGYLQCLLRSLEAFKDPQLTEVVLVTQETQYATTCEAIAEPDIAQLSVPIRVVQTPDGHYNHAAALNAGAAVATGNLLLFADDDTEALHSYWLQTLCAYMEQSDIGCVAPRLTLQVQKDPRLVGGPMIAGLLNSTAPYLGERGLLEEQGVYSRLQTAQDVTTVAGHCFLTRRSLWQSLNGFNTTEFSLYYTVLDYCLRAGYEGYRHVWTPISNVLHQGSKTVAFLAYDPEKSLYLQGQAITEKEHLLRRWGSTLARDGCYNRHLSLVRAYDIETDIVIDWHRSRKDRPTVLALPISSGSGQYRVVEPLHAVQNAGLAKTCVVLPMVNRNVRTPTAIELARANPDRLIVQHSIADLQFKLLREYRLVCPELFIVQMVDDLLRNLSKHHPNYNIHQREGDTRMREALSLSNRLITSTQPLADFYQKYCDDVHVMPNCLDEEDWGIFYHGPPPERQRLRVGWAGAAQHLGDLQMMTDVVATLSDKVDWIFMGMCPDDLRPYIKEFHPFVSYRQYPKKLSSLDLDIAIAPLEDNQFNECKSNLRLLEYGAMGWPVVCSDVYPFRVANPPVYKCKNNSKEWLENIEALINNRELRVQKGKQLHEWVEDNFYISKNAHEWHRKIFE
jgi:O-antigen biosynthesis protein